MNITKNITYINTQATSKHHVSVIIYVQGICPNLRQNRNHTMVSMLPFYYCNEKDAAGIKVPLAGEHLHLKYFHTVFFFTSD